MTTTTTRNADLLNRIADAIEQYSDRYNQNVWSTARKDTILPKLGPDGVTVIDGDNLCGTACCIAGHAALMSGKARLKVEKVSYTWDVEDFYFDTHWIARNGKLMDDEWVPFVGKKELGLTNREADILFGGEWKPIPGMTVPEALRALAEGAAIEDVTNQYYLNDREEGLYSSRHTDDVGRYYWGQFDSWESYKKYI